MLNAKVFESSPSAAPAIARRLIQTCLAGVSRAIRGCSCAAPSRGSTDVRAAGPGWAEARIWRTELSLLVVLGLTAGHSGPAEAMQLAKIGQWGSGPYNDIAVVGDYAYAAAGATGIDILDISDPTAPVRVGGYVTAGSAEAVAVAGSVAYVADAVSGLQIVDVSDPTAPVRLGGYDTARWAISVAVAGDVVYVADDDGGLVILADVADGIGVYRPSTKHFHLDANGDGQWGAGDWESGLFGASGFEPVVGDWDGDGRDDIGVYRTSKGWFYLDTNRNGAWNAGSDRLLKLGGGAGFLPVAGDWNGDESDEVGVYQSATGKFYLDLDGNGSRISGEDISAQLGTGGDKPVAGRWGP